MVKVIIVKDMDILRESLKYMIESDSEMEVVGLACNGQEAYELCKEHHPDIVLMDIKMPGCDGFEGTKLIKSSFPNIKVLILTTFEDEKSVFDAISCGVDGYITKDILPHQLQQSIKSVILGLGIVKRNIMSSVVKNSDSNTQKDMDIDALNLTDKEKTLIRLVVEGKSYRDMGKETCLSEGYIRNMVSDIIIKLKLKDRVQLAVFAVKNKIV